MSDEYKLITEKVGLWGAVALLIGTAIGMSIFIVPTQFLETAGPSISVAIVVSILPMILGVLGLLQLGGAIPVAGGAYVYASRLIGPLYGMLSIFIPLLAIWAYLVFASLGFAEFFEFFTAEFANITFGALGTVLLMWALLGSFVIINYFGIQIVVKVQLALIAFLLFGLTTFVVLGALNIDPGNYEPLFPSEPVGDVSAPFAEGIFPFVEAFIALYIPFQGFTMIVEIGEELENPIENIPKVLAIGMTIVTILSIGVIVVLAGMVPWHEAGEIVEAYGGIAFALTEHSGDGSIFLFGGVIVALAALIGAATTINTLITSYSRTVMRAGRDDVLPKSFAELHEDYDTPYRAIFLLGVPPIILAPVVVFLDGIFTVEALDWLVVVVVSGIFFVFAFLGYAIWRLPKVFPNRYEHSFYKLPMPVLKVVAVGNTVLSIGFAIAIGVTQPSALAVVFLWAGLAYVTYRYRLHTYSGVGSLKDRMKELDSHE